MHRGRGNQTLDHGWAGSQDLSAAQLIHQGFGDRHGVGRAEGHRQQPSQQFALVLRSEHGKAEHRAQRIELLTPCLRARTVGRERTGSDAELVGNQAERQSRDSLIRPQQPTRVTESTELQREAELVRIAAAAFHNSQVGGAQRPVLDQ